MIDPVRLIEYDAWAHQRWLECLREREDDARAWHVFRHAVGCSVDWMEGCHVAALPPRPPLTPNPDEFELAIEAIRVRWRRLIEEEDLSCTIDWGPTTLSLADVIQHVANHGTYHRGHLRGLAEAQGWTDFPDTDWVKWEREVQRVAKPSVPRD